MTKYNLLWFATGLIVGGTVVYLRDKKLLEEYKTTNNELIDVSDKLASQIEEQDLKEYKEEVKEEETLEKITEEYKTITNDKPLCKEVDGYITEVYEKPKKNKPYVIADDRLGDCDYQIEYYYYLTDGNVIDDYDNIVKDSKKRFGTALKYFGEFTEEVCVRDDNKKIDYQILRSEKSYEEMVGTEEVE